MKTNSPSAFVVVVCTAASAGTYLFAIQPYLERGSTIGWVGATLAVAFALNALVALVFTRAGYVIPDPLPFLRVGTGGIDVDHDLGDVLVTRGAKFRLQSEFKKEAFADQTFTSDWALICTVLGGKIVDYRFFEDSAALAAADPAMTSPAPR